MNVRANKSESARVGAPKPSTVLVVNIRSRRGAELFRAAHLELKRAGVELSLAYRIRKQRDLLRAIKGAIKDEATTRVVVGGGDGTISTVADAIAYRQITLGLLPLGTGNDTIRLMGIPVDLAGACRVIAEGREQPVNLGRVNHRYFLNTALIGFPAHINHSVPGWLKRLFGKTAYAIAASLVLLRPRPFAATITVDGVRHQLHTTMVALGNGRFHNPAHAMPEGEVENLDRLIVQAPRDAKITTLMRLGLKYARDGQLDPNLLLTWTGSEVTVETDTPQEIDVDGEYVDHTPARVALAPGALRVIVPAPAASATSGDDARPAA